MRKKDRGEESVLTCIHGAIPHSSKRIKFPCILEEVDLTVKEPDEILHKFHCYPPDVPLSFQLIAAWYCSRAVMNAVSSSVQ